jgi:hypothetical protein
VRAWWWYTCVMIMCVFVHVCLDDRIVEADSMSDEVRVAMAVCALRVTLTLTLCARVVGWWQEESRSTAVRRCDRSVVCVVCLCDRRSRYTQLRARWRSYATRRAVARALGVSTWRWRSRSVCDSSCWSDVYAWGDW